MTLTEYSTRMFAYQLQQVDRMNEIYLGAWANAQSKGLKEGDSYQNFFDYEKAIKEIYNPDGLDPDLLNIARRVQEFHQKQRKEVTNGRRLYNNSDSKS